MSDDTRTLAGLLSAIVQERADKPAKGETDIWYEAVCAALFTAAFTSLPIVAQQSTEETFDQELANLFSDLSVVASDWIEDRMSRAGGWFTRGRVKYDVSAHLKERLAMYFQEGESAMSERGYSLADATSHAIVAVGTQALIALTYKDRALRKVDMREVLSMILERCESTADELRDAIYQRS